MFSHNLEERVKRLEEEIAYLQKDMANLITTIENFEPEVHYHYYLDMRTSKENEQENPPDLNDFI